MRGNPVELSCPMLYDSRDERRTIDLRLEATIFVVVDGRVVYVLSSFLGKAMGAARGVGSSPTGSTCFLSLFIVSGTSIALSACCSH